MNIDQYNKRQAAKFAKKAKGTKTKSQRSASAKVGAAKRKLRKIESEIDDSPKGLWGLIRGKK